MSKIAYLSKSIIPSRTANSVHVMKMCQALASYNHDVTLYSYKGNYDIDAYSFYGVINNFKIEQTIMRFKGVLQPIYHLARIYKDISKKNKLKPEIIYSRDLLSLFALRNNGIPFAYEAHSFTSSKIHKQLEKIIFRNSNFVFLGVISDSLRQDYLREYPYLLKEKIIVLPDGADIPKDIELLTVDVEVKNKFSNYRPQIGYIGHLYEGRGIDIVIKVSRKMKNCDFHIIGGEEKDIKSWSKLVCDQDNIHFHGFVPNFKLINYYNHLDILLAPYQAEVMVGSGKTDTSKWMSPMKIFEYMSYKKCIISSNLDVLKEVLTDGYNSILVAPTDIDQWVSAINKVVEDRDLFNRLSTNAYNDLVLKYTWSKRAKTIIERFINN